MVWAEDSVLHVQWQGHTYEVRLGGGVQPRLWPVAGTGDMWEASLRIRRLEQAVITVMAVPRLAGDDSPPRVPDIRVWRGPRAAAVPAGTTGFLGRALPQLRDTVEDHTLDSAALGTSRQVIIYRQPAGRAVARLRARGRESARGFAWSLESAILARAVPPFLLVGVHNAPVAARSWPDLRTQEYLPGHNRRRFDAHLGFVTSEVVRWAGERFGPVEGPWVASGFSSGAGSEAPGILQGPAVAVVIHISTGPFFHSFTGADLRLCPNYPQIYAQAVIVAGQKAAGEHESREEAVISRDTLPSGGPEVTLMRIAC